MRYKNLKIEQRDDGLWSASVDILSSKDWWKLFSVEDNKNSAEENILKYLKNNNATEKTDNTLDL